MYHEDMRRKTMAAAGKRTDKKVSSSARTACPRATQTELLPALDISLVFNLVFAKGGAVPPKAQTVPDPFCHKTRWKTLNISPETCQSLWGFFLFHIHDPNGRIKNMSLIGKSLFFILVFVQLKNRHMPLFCTIQTLMEPKNSKKRTSCVKFTLKNLEV